MKEQNNILEMRGIEKRFGGTYALKQVDFSLQKGEVLGLIGENGAGKSTLIKILGGIYTKDAGDIFVNGEKVQINLRRIWRIRRPGWLSWGSWIQRGVNT